MKKARGFSLIEIMVAIALGMLLILGLGKMFVSMKQTATLRQSLSTMQMDERTAMLFMETSIKNAGFNPTPVSSAVSITFPAAGAMAAGQSIYGTGDANAGADTLTVRFIASTSVAGQQGCSPSLNAGDIYTDVFSVAGNYLVCAETDNTKGTTSTVNLISGVSGMNEWFGVDTVGAGSQTEYLTGNQVTTAGDWTKTSNVNGAPVVKTVTLTLIFTNSLAGQAGQPATVSLTETIPYIIGI